MAFMFVAWAGLIYLPDYPLPSYKGDASCETFNGVKEIYWVLVGFVTFVLSHSCLRMFSEA